MSDAVKRRAERRRQKFLLESQKKMQEIVGVKDDDSTTESQYLKVKLDKQFDTPANKNPQLGLPSPNQKVANNTLPPQLNNDMLNSMLSQNNPFLSNTNQVKPAQKATVSLTTLMFLVFGGVLTAFLPLILATSSVQVENVSIEIMFALVEVLVLSNLVVLEKCNIFYVPGLLSFFLKFAGVSTEKEKLLIQAVKTFGLLQLVCSHFILFYFPFVLCHLFLY